jgi:glycosyltransferase involved in cell wall biosynthesis
MTTPRPTRVDIVLNSLGIGGAERHSLGLADALMARGFDVRVIALSATEGPRRQDATPATTRAVQLTRRGAVDLATLRAYRRLIRADAPDVTITVNQYPLAFAWLATLFSKRAPMLQIMHTIELPHEDNALKRWLYPRLMRVPAAVAYVCELQRQHWRRAGIRAKPDHCVHNGIDVERFHPQSPAVVAATRAALGLENDELVVGLCAVLRPEKRHDLLLHALALLAQRGEAVHALLIGDGPERERIVALAHALDISHAVHITGYQQDVVPFIGACDAMCLVSDHEAFSLSILESMAMAKAVVATRAGGVQEQITDGETGLLIARNDAPALANALSRLRDPSIRAALGERAMARARSQFSASTMFARYAGIVRQLAPLPLSTRHGS